MKSLFILLSFVISVTTAYSQAKTYTIEQDFTSIKVSNKVNIEIIPNAEETKIEITGYSDEDLKWKVEQGVLKIRLPLDALFSESNTLVKLYVNTFTKLTLNNGVDAEITELMKQDHLNLDLSEGSFLSAEFDLRSLKTKSITGATLQVKGSSKHHYITVKTGGMVEAKEFKSKNADVKISYGGTIDVFASNKIKAAVTAGGQISIYGNPSQVDSKTKLGGSIDLKD